MTQVVTITEIRIPRQKGKVNGKVIPKGKYVEYHLREWLRHNLDVITDKDLSELAEAVTNVIIRSVNGGNTVRLFISLRHSGVIKINGMEKSYYDFGLSIYTNNKLLHVYRFVKKRPDVEIVVENNSDGSNEPGLPVFEVDGDFMNIANYVMDYVKAYGKDRKRRVNDYVVMVNFARFVETLNMFHDSFLSSETTKLIGTKFTFLAYKYLRDSGYFAYVNAINHGGSE
jgi:hypothetical protein